MVSAREKHASLAVLELAASRVFKTEWRSAALLRCFTTDLTTASSKGGVKGNSVVKVRAAI